MKIFAIGFITGAIFSYAGFLNFIVSFSAGIMFATVFHPQVKEYVEKIRCYIK